MASGSQATFQLLMAATVANLTLVMSMDAGRDAASAALGGALGGLMPLPGALWRVFGQNPASKRLGKWIRDAIGLLAPIRLRPARTLGGVRQNLAFRLGF